MSSASFPPGPLVGDLTFTPLPDKTIKFVDRDNTYNAHPAPLPELNGFGCHRLRAVV